MEKLDRRQFLAELGLGAIGIGIGLRPALASTDARPAPRVTTLAGVVEGVWSGKVRVFKGVPYGVDTRTTRFLPPQPVAPWTDVKACKDWAPRAPQQAPDPVSAGFNILEDAPVHYHLPPDLGPQSEDCLHLNLWAPGGHGKHPVLVYFHGPAYNNGTVNTVLFDGTRLAARGDVVVVTVNHRLNAFGFLELAELAGDAYRESGNVGMLDLVLALRWVRDNIAGFGGDPGNVTIFGQSGGGSKCATLMAMPAAHGLFQRVWTMSGQQVTVAPIEKAANRAKAALAAMGVAGPVTREVLDGLTVDQILTGARATGGWMPVKDGAVLQRDPFEPDAAPESAAIPMVLGGTRDEAMAASAWRLGGMTWEQLPAELTQQLAAVLGPLTTAQVIARYRAIYPSYRPVDVYVASIAALRAWPGIVIEAERRAVSSPGKTWVYQMDFGTPTAEGRAPLTLDAAFLFDNLALVPGMIGAHEAEIAAAQPLASQMADSLIAFARTGDPNCKGLPKWPSYDLKDRQTMVFDRATQVVSDPRSEERQLAAREHYRQPGT